MFKGFVPGRCGIALNKQKRAHDFLAGGLVPGARCLMGREVEGKALRTCTLASGRLAWHQGTISGHFVNVVPPGSVNDPGVRAGDTVAWEPGVRERSRRPSPLLTPRVVPRPVLPGLVHGHVHRLPGGQGGPVSDSEWERDKDGEVFACWWAGVGDWY